MKTIYSVMLAATMALGTAAQQTEEVVFDLTQKTNFDLCTKTSLTYDRSTDEAWTFSSYSDYVTMYNYRISYYDDYLITPDLPLEAGSMYAVKCRPSSYMSGDAGTSQLKILLGQGDDVASYETLLTTDKLPYENYSSPVETVEATFTVAESGMYRISFNAGPKAIYIKDAKIVNRGQSAKPKAANNFRLSPDPDGELKVTISFTMPETTITGQPLSDTKYNVYRGVQKIKNAIAATPGEAVSFAETRGESGMISYAVEIIAGEEISDKLTAETYIGPETPEAPANVQLTQQDGKFAVTWEAPVAGIHGAALSPEKLTYTVYRIVDDNPEAVADGIGECTFAESVEPMGLQTLRYAVEAVYGKQAKKSTQALSPQIRIGTASLPFADSFAGATLSSLWDNELVTCTSTNRPANHFWQAKESMSRPACTPYDGDGGLLVYDSYNIQNNNSARLSTPPIAYNAGDNPVLSFAKFNYSGSYSKNDKVKVQVSCDYGEWIDVPEAEFKPNGEPAGEWVLVNVPIVDALQEGTKSYRVALLGESNYGESFVFDAVRIFNLLEKDLELSSFSIPENAVAGNEFSIKVKISNNGTADVEPDDYSLVIDSDFPDNILMPELVAIPSLAEATYDIKVALNSLHLLESDTYTFTAKVDYAGDEVSDNNESNTATLTASHGTGTAASELTATADEDGGYTLRWKAPKDLQYKPVNIVESFEDEAFKDDSTGPFNGWTIIDLDGQGGDNWFTANGPAFNLAVNAGTPSGKDGNNVLGVTVKSNVQQDDWIISPKIACKEGSTMRLDFLMGCRQISSFGNTYEVSLVYTTADSYDVLNPQNDFTHMVGSSIKSSSVNDSKLPQDNKMHELSFEEIPAEATYVALHFTAKGSYNPAMWVDNIRLTEVEENVLLGYRVYSADQGLLHDGLVDPDVTEYKLVAPKASTFAAARNVFVSAIYPDGEAEPSNMLNLNAIVSGVESIADGEADAPAEYFNLQGIRIANPSGGIYIIRRGNKTSKIYVK